MYSMSNMKRNNEIRQHPEGGARLSWPSWFECFHNYTAPKLLAVRIASLTSMTIASTSYEGLQMQGVHLGFFDGMFDVILQDLVKASMTRYSGFLVSGFASSRI